MRIENASLLQVQTGRNGRKVLVEHDVLDVVRQLQEISPALHVNYNEYGNYFSVVETCDDGAERLVTTVKELDSRLVDHVRKIGSESWNRELGDQIDKMDDQAEKDRKSAFREKVGEAGEKLHHAIGRDLGWKNKIWIPGYDK